jgi:hypothetical protein
MIDYWLGPTPPSLVTIEILDGEKIVRRFSTDAPSTDSSFLPLMDSLPRLEGSTPRLSRNAGLNRFVWDLRHAGAWNPNTRQSARGGPMGLPGTYTVRLRAGGGVETRSLVVRADPRITRDGVTLEVLREQLAHNLRVRDLVSEVNIAVAQLQRARRLAPAGSPMRARLDSLERLLVTPPIRYSHPALQAHVDYLYSAMSSADQKVSRDAVERYRVLRREFDALRPELKAALGGAPATSRGNGTDRPTAAFN